MLVSPADLLTGCWALAAGPLSEPGVRRDRAPALLLTMVSRSPAHACPQRHPVNVYTIPVHPPSAQSGRRSPGPFPPLAVPSGAVESTMSDKQAKVISRRIFRLRPGPHRARGVRFRAWARGWALESVPCALPESLLESHRVTSGRSPVRPPQPPGPDQRAWSRPAVDSEGPCEPDGSHAEHARPQWGLRAPRESPKGEPHRCPSSLHPPPRAEPVCRGLRRL